MPCRRDTPMLTLWLAHWICLRLQSGRIRQLCCFKAPECVGTCYSNSHPHGLLSGDPEDMDRGPRAGGLWEANVPSGGLHPSMVLLSQERYTCPSLALHPREPVFLAQTNGNYLALFSSVWPYRMSRRRRYEGHKVPQSLLPRSTADHWPQSL